MNRSPPFKESNVVVCKNRGTQYGPKHFRILIMGSPEEVPLILGCPCAKDIRTVGVCKGDPMFEIPMSCPKCKKILHVARPARDSAL